MSEQNHVFKKDGNVDLSMVDNAIKRIPQDERDDILSSFDTFKQYLTKRIELGERIGLNEEQMAKIAEKVANYLANHEDPRNREEKLLQELWKSGNKEQQHALAHMLVHLVHEHPKH